MKKSSCKCQYISKNITNLLRSTLNCIQQNKIYPLAFNVSKPGGNNLPQKVSSNAHGHLECNCYLS